MASTVKLIGRRKDLRPYIQFINQLFKENGQIHYHHIHGIEAGFIQIKQNEFYLAIDTKNKIASAFKKIDPDTWECFFQGYPVLASRRTKQQTIVNFLQETKSKLSANTLYFPLIYANYRFSIFFSNMDFFHTYKRLPTQIIEPPLDHQIIWGRVRTRCGSQADRRKKRFEKSLYVRELTGVDVKKELAAVEIKSWKHSCRQDMLSRDNQIDFYNYLIKSDLAKVTFVYYDNLPIAFRIDTAIKKVLYVLKWSYNQEYKKYSPGFYLVAIDLFKRSNNKKNLYVDLYGSPDHLKGLLKTAEIERFDAILTSDPKTAKKIACKKTLYDKRIINNYKQGRSIKSLFKTD